MSKMCVLSIFTLLSEKVVQNQSYKGQGQGQSHRGQGQVQEGQGHKVKIKVIGLTLCPHPLVGGSTRGHCHFNNAPGNNSLVSALHDVCINPLP